MRRNDLKAKLEDLVDRTGRVEDMLDVLAGIYHERARHPEYAELRGQMNATAHVLHEASEAVAGIFDEEDEEALEHAAGRAAWQEAHEAGRRNPDDEGKAVVLDGHKVFVHKEKAAYGPYSLAKKMTVYVVTTEDGKVLTDPHTTQREALAQARRMLALRENPASLVTAGSLGLKKIHNDLYQSPDERFRIVRVVHPDGSEWWYWRDEVKKEGGDDLFKRKWEVVEALEDYMKTQGLRAPRTRN